MEYDTDRLWTEEELAGRMHRSPETIRDWRKKGLGPAWFKPAGGRGGKVLYRNAALLDWEAEQERMQAGKRAS